MGVVCNCRLESINIKSENKNIDVLSKSQQEKLTSYLINNFNNTSLGILICLYTGIRIGEVCALKFDDISMADKTVHIRKTMQRVQNFAPLKETKTDVIISTPKSKSSVRDIPMPEFLITTIAENNMYIPKAYLLTGELYNYVEPRTLENRFKSCIRSCGIEDVSFHTLRHPYVKLKLKLSSAYFRRIFSTKILDFPLDFKPVFGIYAHLFNEHIRKCLC